MNKLLIRVFVYMLVAIFVSLMFVGSIHSSILGNGEFMNHQVLNAKELGTFYRVINEYTDLRYFAENKMHYEVMKIDMSTVKTDQVMQENTIVGIYDEFGDWAIGSQKDIDLDEARQYLDRSSNQLIQIICPPNIPRDYFILPARTKDDKEIYFVIAWAADSYNVLRKYGYVTYKIQMVAIGVALLITFVPVTISLAFGYLLPLRRLKRAADTIASGELDFNIRSQGLDEIKALSKSFEHMRFELEESNKREQVLKDAHRQLITNMSHDLKTPITSIKGYVEGLLDGKGTTPERMDRYLKTIQSKTLYLDAMINDLFQFSKLDLGEYKLDRKIWNSVEVMNIIIEPIQLEVEDAGWSFDFKSSVPNTLLYVDIVRIAQVFENVIQNSLKYGDAEGKITVEAFIKDHYYGVSICDTGMGINPEALPYVFEAFYREDTSRSHQVGGSGLGLAICKKIMELHEGRIEVTSIYGEGTCMKLYFPLSLVNLESSGH